MKNKIFSIAAAAAVCGVMLTSQAFAVDIAADVSIYAPDAKNIAERVNKTFSEEDGFSVDADTIMPIYRASIYDYAKTGEFNFVLDNTYEVTSYFGDLVNKDGSYAGTMTFIADGDAPGFLIHSPSEDASLAIDYRANAERISRLMSENNISTDIKEAKIAYVEGLGYVYYINNGTDEVFVAANFKGTSDKYFTEENGGIIVVNDEFKRNAALDLAERDAQMNDNGNNPITGGNSSNADSEPLTGGVPSDENNPLTGGTASALVVGIGLAVCGSGFAVVKRRK